MYFFLFIDDAADSLLPDCSIMWWNLWVSSSMWPSQVSESLSWAALCTWGSAVHSEMYEAPRVLWTPLCYTLSQWTVSWFSLQGNGMDKRKHYNKQCSVMNIKDLFWIALLARFVHHKQDINSKPPALFFSLLVIILGQSLYFFLFHGQILSLITVCRGPNIFNDWYINPLLSSTHIINNFKFTGWDFMWVWVQKSNLAVFWKWPWVPSGGHLYAGLPDAEHEQWLHCRPLWDIHCNSKAR